MRKEIIVGIASAALLATSLHAMAKPQPQNGPSQHTNNGNNGNNGNQGNHGHNGNGNNGNNVKNSYTKGQPPYGKAWGHFKNSGNHGSNGHNKNTKQGGYTPKTPSKNTPTVGVGTINQTVQSNGPATNNAHAYTGKISGAGASVSATATGASAAVGVSSIQNSKQPISSITVNTINQTAINKNTVTNNGSVLGQKGRSPDVTGPGASASSGATGASAMASITSTNDTKFPTVSAGKINQTAINYNTVTNNGHVYVGKVSGANAYAGTSAVGASAVVSINITGSSGGGYKRR